MQSHAWDAGTNRTERSDAAFRVHSAIHQHRRLMVSRVADHVLRLRDPVLGIDQRVRMIGLWEFYGMVIYIIFERVQYKNMRNIRSCKRNI